MKRSIFPILVVLLFVFIAVAVYTSSTKTKLVGSSQSEYQEKEKAKEEIDVVPPEYPDGYTKTLEFGDDSDQVGRLVEDLKKAGIQLTSTTTFNLEMEHILQEFQEHYHLKKTGKADGPTLHKIIKLGRLEVSKENPEATWEKELFNWKVTNPGRRELEGYMDKDSAFPGERVTFYISSKQSYSAKFYRMGFYGEQGGLLMDELHNLKANPKNTYPTMESTAANWEPSFHFDIPNDWPTGVYMVKLIDSLGKESHIPLIVKEKNPKAQFAILLSTHTYQAYNNWGGKSLYGYNSSNKEAAIAVSHNRPYTSWDGAGEFFLFEYNFIRWLAKQNYDVTYITDTDVHNGILDQMKIQALIIPGHDEYWTKKMRDDIEKHSKSDMNIGLFNANVAYWQTRMENNRNMVAYKNRADEDPFLKSNPIETTTTFRSAPVKRPEDQLFGIMYQGIPEPKHNSLVVTNPDHWHYEGTGLKKGDTIEGIVGGEIDRYGGAIPNVEVIASSPVMLYGEKATSDVVWYEKPEGGKVFATGTFYWSWFLDPYNHKGVATHNEDIEQITINALDALLK